MLGLKKFVNVMVITSQFKPCTTW